MRKGKVKRQGRVGLVAAVGVKKRPQGRNLPTTLKQVSVSANISHPQIHIHVHAVTSSLARSKTKRFHDITDIQKLADSTDANTHTLTNITTTIYMPAG